MPPVKAYALERGLPVYQPASLRSERSQRELAGLRPDVVVVAAYGKILPPLALNTPTYGCLNLHPSLLPKYRGPSPVATAILEGEAVTGVSLMLLDEGMDTGPVIAQLEHPLSGRETNETLTATLFQLGAELLLRELAPWVAGGLTARPQDGTQATVTRKLERADGQADWGLPAEALERRRRAFTPWPGLFTHWQGKALKLLDVVALPPEDIRLRRTVPGQVVLLETGEVPVGVGCGQGLLGLKAVQLEGRRAIAAGEFLMGYPQFIGARL
jgi:methionyl-tRNA formyltransferase